LQTSLPGFALLGLEAVCAPRGFLLLRGQQSWQPGEVVGGHREGEAGAHPFDSAIDGLRHAADGLCAAEGLFNPFAMLDRQGASFARAVEPGARYQSEEDCEVAKAGEVEDMKTGPTELRSTALTEAEEAMVVAFRRHTLLPLDDCLYALQPAIPHLTRSALHRCLQRHGISRLPDVEGDKPKRQKFKRCPIGFFHIGIAEVQTAEV
jgi:hypothetical protein